MPTLLEPKKSVASFVVVMRSSLNPEAISLDPGRGVPLPRDGSKTLIFRHGPDADACTSKPMQIAGSFRCRVFIAIWCV